MEFKGNLRTLQEIRATALYMLPLSEDYINLLQATPQNPKYHAEGDVYVHTCKVVEEFQKAHTAMPFSEEEAKILYWASVLHDIGKPSVTVWKQNRWSARGHEDAGFPIARNILLQNPEISPTQRRKILELVRWHHLPLRWMLDSQPLISFQQMAMEIDLERVATFAYFDLQGRICEGKEKILNQWQEFKNIANSITHQIGRWDYLQYQYGEADRLHQNALANAYKMQRPDIWMKLLQTPPIPAPRRSFECIFPIGIRHSKIDQYLLENYPQAMRLSAQDWLVEGELPEHPFEQQHILTTFRHNIGRYAYSQPEIVLDGMHLNAATRWKLVEMLKGLGAKVSYLFFEMSLDELLADLPATKMDENAVKEAFRQLRYPHPWEAHQIKWVETDSLPKCILS